MRFICEKCGKSLAIALWVARKTAMCNNKECEEYNVKIYYD